VAEGSGVCDLASGRRHQAGLAGGATNQVARYLVTLKGGIVPVVNV